LSPEAPLPEIAPSELLTAIEAGRPIQIIDVRNATRVSQGRIDLVAPERFINIVGSQLRALTSLAGTGIDPAIPAAVVCGHGNDSRVVTAHLVTLGLDARSVRGGMTAWMDVVVERPLAAPPALDHLVQFDRVGKGALGYLLVSDGEALVVDPPRDSSAFVEAARRLGARIVGVADTHVHADYISGATALSRSLGVPYYLHPADSAYAYDGTPGRLAYTPLSDGAEIRFGRCRVIAEHTPGHTEGMTTLRIGNDAVLTGDFVFIESLGRPDLAGRAGEWSEKLWNSVERARRSWPAEITVLPGHYSSPSERAADRSVRGTFGELLRSNTALAITDRDAFRAWASVPGSFPEAYRTIKAVNVLLQDVTDEEASVLEVGRNECAVRAPAH